MAIKFPVDCTSNADRVEYIYRAQELLRLIHNMFGKWKQDGITKAEWDMFPAKLKILFPYTVSISEQQYAEFKEFFNAKSRIIADELMTYRNPLKSSTRWTPDIGEI